MIGETIKKSENNDTSLNSEVLLRVTGVSKSFGGVQALKDVSFDLRKNEILAFVGGNGAGKSTMVGILAGVQFPDRGTIEIDGQKVKINSVHISRSLGIEVVYQDLGLVPNMGGAFNLFLGRPLRKYGILLDTKKMEAAAREVLEKIHVSTVQDISVPVESLSGGQRQALAVGRVVHWRNRIVVLDEPAAALGPEETEQVIRLIKELREYGSSVIVVTHNMDHVYEVADRVLVFRNGKSYGPIVCSKISAKELVSLIMLGEEHLENKNYEWNAI